MQADKTSSTAVAERPRDASCLSVVSFNGTKRRIVLYCKGVFIATQLNSTQLDVELSTRSQREQLSPINKRSDPVDSVCRS